MTAWNRAAERIFGFTPEEAIGRSIALILPPDRLREEEESLAQVRAGITVEHYETIRWRKDGSLIDISLTVSPVNDRDGQLMSALTIARDISERRRLLRELEDATCVKDEFLATLSHELRTPLNAVMGYARMLRSVDLSSQSREHAIDLVNRNAQVLSRLVADMLDVSAMVAGKMPLRREPCDLTAILQAAIEVVRPTANAMSLRLVYMVGKGPLIVLGDPDRLQQVFWNLLANAVKFTPQGGRIEVRGSRNSGQVEVAIADTGTGISPDFMPHLFEKFRQAESGPSRRFGGLGLGLALVRHLVQLHGGSVAAASPGPGKGSTFQVTLPELLESNAESEHGLQAAS